MAWKIDRDYLNDPVEEGEVTAYEDGTVPSRVGHGEQHTRIPMLAAVIGMESEPLPETVTKVRFRLLDDDGEVYYGGWLHDDDECENQSAALDFGMGDAGCTTIQVKRDDAWVTEIS